MSKTIIFQWTGFAPREIYDAVPEGKRHITQASCVAVFPSVAAFLRATDSKRSRLPYISVHDTFFRRGDVQNEGARLAMDNPGVVYWKDNLRHEKQDSPWLVHPTPERS